VSKISFGMMVSLDGYIAGPEGGPPFPPPEDALHWHFNELQKQASVSLYGRRMYEVMRYWETADQVPNTPEVELDFARAWQRTPKVVISTTLTEVGPNARLIKTDLEQAVKALRDEPGGEIQVAGAGLAASLARLGLIDEYRLYFMPVVLGGGTPFFEANRHLQLEPLGTEQLTQGVLLARYRPLT
jgi:dihydrofolate reductase